MRILKHFFHICWQELRNQNKTKCDSKINSYSSKMSSSLLGKSFMALLLLEKLWHVGYSIASKLWLAFYIRFCNLWNLTSQSFFGSFESTNITEFSFRSLWKFRKPWIYFCHLWKLCSSLICQKTISDKYYFVILNFTNSKYCFASRGRRRLRPSPTCSIIW